MIATIVVSDRFREYILRKRIIISWKNFFNTLTDERVVSILTNKETKPDIIIGLNNGIVPASIIATNLGIEELYYYHMFPSIDNKGCRSNLVNINNRNLDLSEKKVLIVDDQTYTGESMNTLYNHLLTMKGAKAENIKRFAVFKYQSNIHNPRLDIPAPGKISGAIKKIPWSFISEHKKLSMHEKKECE